MIGSGLDIVDLLNEANETFQSRVHTALPAKVLSYDPAKQTVTCQPCVKDIGWTEDDQKVYTELPVCQNVPVCFPRGGGFALTFPLEPGDHVLLVFSELGIQEWRSTGETSEPRDTRKKSFGHPLAVPGAFPKPLALSTASSSKLCVGNDGPIQIQIDSEIRLGSAATIPVALATPLTTYATAIQTALAALHTAIGTFANAVPGATVPASALATAISTCSTAVSAATSALASTAAATKVKAV